MIRKPINGSENASKTRPAKITPLALNGPNPHTSNKNLSALGGSSGSGGR
jgi:hypothetical protein